MFWNCYLNRPKVTVLQNKMHNPHCTEVLFMHMFIKTAVLSALALGHNIIYSTPSIHCLATVYNSIPWYTWTLDIYWVFSDSRFSIPYHFTSKERHLEPSSFLPLISKPSPQYLRVHNSCDHYTRTCPNDIPLHTLGPSLSGQADDLNECNFIIFIA